MRCNSGAIWIAVGRPVRRHVCERLDAGLRPARPGGDFDAAEARDGGGAGAGGGGD